VPLQPTGATEILRRPAVVAGEGRELVVGQQRDRVIQVPVVEPAVDLRRANDARGGRGKGGAFVKSDAGVVVGNDAATRGGRRDADGLRAGRQVDAHVFDPPGRGQRGDEHAVDGQGPAGAVLHADRD